MFVVVSYDIGNDRRRLKTANLLMDYGGERVQRSVFECYITARNLKRLQQRLEDLIDEENDSVRLYVLCENCRPRAVFMGTAKPTDEPGLRII